MNEQRQVQHTQTTGLKTIQLDRNEENRLLVFDQDLTYPILLSVNLLVTKPDPPQLANKAISINNTNESSSDISTISLTKSISASSLDNNVLNVAQNQLP